MINPRISADWSTTNQIAPFCCKNVEVVYPTPGHLGLGVIFTTQA